MLLTDAGPLVALGNRNDRNHARCAAVVAALSEPMVTTLAAFAEAMYLVGSHGGWTAQDRLWGLVERQVLLFHDLDAELLARCRLLMRQYQDVPMDLADATLVALAESLRLYRIFTLDSDFRIYRPKGRGTFEILPA